MADAVTCAIDTSAILAHLQDEAGGDVVLEWLERGAAVSILNVQELASKLAEAGVEREAVAATLADLSLEVRPITVDLALDAGFMRAGAGRRGLSHGDRACLALARQLGLPAVTADRPWADVAPALGVEASLIR